MDIHIIGDLPIYVALDSADVWADPENFQLDDQYVPTAVPVCRPTTSARTASCGATPSTLGADEGRRLRLVDTPHRRRGKLYDVIRIDHFRGFESYWAVPYGETTAKNGRWVTGPGMALVGVLTGWFPQLEFIAAGPGLSHPGGGAAAARLRPPGHEGAGICLRFP